MTDKDKEAHDLEDQIQELGQRSARLGIWMEHVESRKGVSTYTIAKNTAKPLIKEIDEERDKLRNRLKVKLANKP